MRMRSAILSLFQVIGSPLPLCKYDIPEKVNIASHEKSPRTIEFTKNDDDKTSSVFSGQFKAYENVPIE